MIVSEDPDALVAQVLALVAAATDLPDLRAGIAFGRAVPRLGDWYGPAVNLAARLHAAGRGRTPSSSPTPSPRRWRSRSATRCQTAGHKRFKGISEPVAVKRLRSCRMTLTNAR